MLCSIIQPTLTVDQGVQTDPPPENYYHVLSAPHGPSTVLFHIMCIIFMINMCVLIILHSKMKIMASIH